jgi:hypothetical protein
VRLSSTGKSQAECCGNDKRNDLFHFILLARPTEVADFACPACHEINVSKKIRPICSHLLQIAIGQKRS